MPTGSKVDNKWFIRVTLPHDPFQLVLKEKLNSLNFADHVRMFMVGHVGQKTEKEHVHILVELSRELQKQSVDKRYKNMFGVSGADYSSKPWDGDMGAGAGSYVFHDPNAIILHNKGFTDEEIQNWRRLNADVQKVVEINKQRASGRCVDRMLTRVKESNRPWTRKEIAMQLVKDIRDGVMYEPGDFMLKRYIEEVYAKQLDDKAWAQYADQRVSDLIGLQVEFVYAENYSRV